MIIATGASKSYKNVAGVEEPILRDNRLRTIVQQYATMLTKQRLRKPEENTLSEMAQRREVECVTSAHFYDSAGDVERVLTQNLEEYGKGRIVFALESSVNVAEPEILYSVSSSLHSINNTGQ